MSTEKIEKLEKALDLLVQAYAAAECVDRACARAISTAEDTVHKVMECGRVSLEEDVLLDEL